MKGQGGEGSVAPSSRPWNDTGWSTPAETSRERDKSERGGARERCNAVATVPEDNYFDDYFAVTETGYANSLGSGEDRPVAGVNAMMNEPTFEAACAPYCEPSTENENPNETSEDVTENYFKASEDANENPCEASEDTNENPYEASEDVNEYPYEASEDADEDPCEGRVNAARLEGLPDVSRGPITKTYEDFGLGRSAKRRTVLEAGANPIEAPDPPLRGEGQTKNETNPTLGTLDDDAALAHRDRVGSVTENPSEDEVEDLTPLVPKGPGPPLQKEETSMVANTEYARLFTQDELDALEAGRPSPAAEEKEEYNKEIEERLFLLDEVELLKKMKKNAAKEKELTLEKLSSLLNLPVETLARTRESSTDELSAPEYWSAWYRRTLAASEEAKRANRDFKAPRVGAVQPD
ncbi:hypothetical protein PF008_g11727 [Phytophthora fragariae]|uniref:Uncharacterized protein n=1 Tax=Phytophthora fragariae TaxID=53985 RepID=A0A6G0RRI2_9STRA|nr:hypothetical protein PF008_g11727 [Phytophthora fragariae]